MLTGLHALFQVVLINAIKDVAKALSDLIGATKGAASKPADDPSMYQLKGAAKVEWSPSQGLGCRWSAGQRSTHENSTGCASELLSHLKKGVFAHGLDPDPKE